MRWIARLEGGPRRVNHAAVLLDDQIFSFGGYCSTGDYQTPKPIDIHVLDTFSFRWKRLDEKDEMWRAKAPYQRYGHTAVVYDGKAYIWGGRNDTDGASNVLHEYDPVKNSWRIVKSQGWTPSARDGHSACVVGEQMIVFGGFEEDFQQFSQETHAFHFPTARWREIRAWGDPPEWRDFHTAVAIGRRMYVFGGRSDQQGPLHSNRELYYTRVKYLDLVSKSWHTPLVNGAVPQGRRSHSAWVYNGKMYIFGGYNGETEDHFNTIHEFDPVECRWREIETIGEKPSARRRQCCILKNHRIFLFGGTMPTSSPFQLGILLDDYEDTHLVDLSDLYVLDYEPSLKTLCAVKLNEQCLSEEELSVLPWDLKLDLMAMCKPNRINNNGREEASG